MRFEGASTSRTPAVLGAAVLMLLGLAVPLAVKAQTVPTGRQVALGAEARCGERTETRTVFDLSRQTIAGRWVTIEGPSFGRPAGRPREPIVAHAVDPRDPMRQYASDGRTIARTADGGCTWTNAYFAPRAQPSVTVNDVGISDAVLQMVVSTTGNAPGRVWALVGPRRESVAPLRVLVSEDGGESWQSQGTGLPLLHSRAQSALPGGIPGERPTALLAVASSDPNRAYVATSSTTEGDGPVFVTTDGGRTWSRAGILDATAEPLGQVSEMAIDPADRDSVWMIAGDGSRLVHSGDAGATWEAIAVSGGSGVSGGSDVRVDGLHISRRRGSPHVQVLGSSNIDEFGTLFRSVNGKDFRPLNLAEPVRGDLQVSQGGDPEGLIASTDFPDQALVLDLAAPEGTLFRSLGVVGLGDVGAPQADATAEPVHWFRRYEGLAAYVPGAGSGTPPPPPKLLPDRLFDADAVARRNGGRVPGTLEPAALEEILPPEGSSQHDYILDLPPLPTPVDVWFLMDTSGSMGGAIEGLQLGIDRIIRGLKAAGMDAQFGLAEYKGENYRYVRLADLAPPGDSLERGLRRLYASGGGEETQFTALYQTATGRGQKDVGISSGQGASWRPEALRIVVHATDEPFGLVGDGPSRDEAVAALNGAGVYHIGLDLSPGARGTSTAPPTRTVKADLDDVARATSTFAPVEGVDCNGDGLLDLESGEPLTCPINRGQDEVEISQAIVSSIRAVRDDTAVALTVVDADGLSVEVADALRVPVNVKVPNRLPFRVAFECPAQMTGDVANVKLLATVRGVPSAPATAKIFCGPPPVARAAPPLALLAPLAPFVATPPQLVPEIEPALSPLQQPSPGQVAAPSVQPGLATQPGQVATAKQSAGRAGPYDTNHGDRSLPEGAAGTLAVGAGLAAGLGALAVGRNRRTEQARQPR